MLPKIFARVILILPWALAVAGLGWLVIRRFPPSGIVTFSIPFDGSSAWIDPFLPGERVTSPGAQKDGWTGQRIIGDPVYSSVRVPGVYDSVNVSLEFRPIHQPLVEIGVLRDAETMAFEFAPIWFAPFESTEWQEASYGTLNGFVRDTSSASLLSTSDFNTLAVWHASATPLALSDPAKPQKTTRVTLRGGHDFWAIPAAGKISFTFEMQDSNRAAGPDNVVFRIYGNGAELKREMVGIGGSRDVKMGTVFKKTVELDHLPPGAYRIQFTADDDVFIRSVTTPCSHWVVGPRLVFGDQIGFATTTQAGVAWSDSRHLSLETFHTEGLQRVSFADADTQLARTHTPYRIDRKDHGIDPKRLDAPVGDVRVVGDGWFSFSPEAFFSPQPRRITDFTDPETEGIRAVLTPYERPEPLENGWYRANVRFPISSDQDRLKIALSVPNVLTRGGAVDIRHVTLTYHRPPLSWNEWWRVLRQELVNAWRRMR
jgi:hypothetical protein